MNEKININVEMINSDLHDRNIKVPNGTTYESLLDILGINQENVLIFKEKRAVPIDGTVVSGDIAIMWIASKG